MSRSDQYIGLPKSAHEFLFRAGILYTEPYDSFAGAYSDNDFLLMEYALEDGRTATEFLQDDPWSGGPMFFIGLRVSDGAEFTWAEQEIGDML